MGEQLWLGPWHSFLSWYWTGGSSWKNHPVYLDIWDIEELFFSRYLCSRSDDQGCPLGGEGGSVNLAPSLNIFTCTPFPFITTQDHEKGIKPVILHMLILCAPNTIQGPTPLSHWSPHKTIHRFILDKTSLISYPAPWFKPVFCSSIWAHFKYSKLGLNRSH